MKEFNKITNILMRERENTKILARIFKFEQLTVQLSRRNKSYKELAIKYYNKAQQNFSVFALGRSLLYFFRSFYAFILAAINDNDAESLMLIKEAMFIRRENSNNLFCLQAVEDSINLLGYSRNKYSLPNVVETTAVQENADFDLQEIKSNLPSLHK